MLVKILSVSMVAFLLSPAAMAEPCLKTGSASEWQGTANVRVYNANEPWDRKLVTQLTVKVSRTADRIHFDLGRVEVPEAGFTTLYPVVAQVKDGVLQQTLESRLVNVGFVGEDRIKFVLNPASFRKVSRIDLKCENENKLVGFIMLESGVDDSYPLGMHGWQLWVQLERKLP